MKRAARIFFHVAAGVSGVLFLLAAGLWPVSFDREYQAERDGRKFSWRVTVSRGEACAEFLAKEEPWNPAAWPPGWIWRTDPPSDLLVSAAAYLDGRRTPVAGFFVGGRTFEGLKLNALCVPLPFLIFLFAPLPLIDVSLIRRRRRRGRWLAAGLCVRCGYDLRASPGRCSECGAVPAASARAPDKSN